MLDLKKLREIREKKGLTQTALAKRVGVSPAFISNIERGEKNASVLTISSIAKVLEIEISDIWTESDSGNPTIFPIRDDGIIVEKTSVKFILPNTADSYLYISEQIKEAGYMNSDVQVITALVKKWCKASEKAKEKIMELLSNEDD